MALICKDKEQATILSTWHNAANVTDTGKKCRQNGLPVLKPEVDYNRGKGGLDHEDCQLAFLCNHENIFYAVDIPVYNSGFTCQSKRQAVPLQHRQEWQPHKGGFRSSHIAPVPRPTKPVCHSYTIAGLGVSSLP